MDVPASPPTVNTAADSGTVKQLNFKASSSIEEDIDILLNSDPPNPIEPETLVTVSKADNILINNTSNNNNNNENKDNNSIDNDKPDNINSLNTNNHDHKDSKIKLKRCRHGRIIIKELSKKKLTQQNSSGYTDKIADQHHISETTNSIKDDHGIDIRNSEINRKEPQSRAEFESQSTSTRTRGDDIVDTPGSNSEGIDVTLDERQLKAAPKPLNNLDRSSTRKRTSNSRSPAHARRSSGSRYHSSRRSCVRSRSRSISRGKSPSSRNPEHERRQSRSPRRRRNSRSSKRDRSPRSARKSDSWSRKRSREEDSNRGKTRNTSHRHRSTHRDSLSPRRHRSHSRSLTPKRGDITNKRRHNVSSNDDQYTRDKHRDRNLSASPRSQVPVHPRRFERSPISNRHSHDESSRLLNSNNVNSDSQNPLKASSSLGELLSANQQIQQQQHQNQQQQDQDQEQQQKRLSASPKPKELETTSMHQDFSPTVQSPPIPFNEDSPSSDIYDPAGPIIPISPGDSPPLSPLDEGSYNDSSFDKSPPRPHTKGVINKDGREDDIIPSSAVQLNQQEKYLQKLNRQERVIEEVKMALKPHYSNRAIDKEQYKDVLRRAVPKICHNKNGEINPIKIRSLVDAYVKKMKHH